MTFKYVDRKSRESQPRQPYRKGSNGGQQIISKTVKLDFPRFVGDDPTEWFNRVEQFFEYLGTVENQKVLTAAYHLEWEAN